MRRRAFIMSFVIAWLIGVAAYALYFYSKPVQDESVPRSAIPAYTTLQATSSQQLDLPPSRASSIPVSTPQPEPPRTLTGVSKERLRYVEQYLPKGAQIAIYPVGETSLKAALGSADFGNSIIQTVVVYNTLESAGGEHDNSLFLAILAPEEGKLIVRSTVRLPNTYVTTNIYDKQTVPFAIRDVTSDGRPEIVVTSATGASLGSDLQVFSVEGSSLRQIGIISGQDVDVYNKGVSKPSLIAAHSKNENETATYEWNGEKFEQTRESVMKQH